VDEISAAASNVYGGRTRGGYNASTSACTVVSNSPFASGNAKGKRKADSAILSAALGPSNGMNKRRGSLFCPRHGSNLSSHDAKDCFSGRPAAAAAAASSSRGWSNITFLCNNNALARASNNIPCRYCRRPWYNGHTCAEYRQAMRANNRNGPSVLAIRATDSDSAAAEDDNDEEKEVKKAYEDSQYNCKFDDFKSLNMRSAFNLMTPIIVEGHRYVAKVDTGSSITCINRKIINKDFSDVKLNNVNGYLNFLSLNGKGEGSKAKRIGRTRPMTVTYTNNISFNHIFEVVEFSDIMETEFDILLGVDILPKLNIYLGGVAFNWPNDIAKESKQFKNVNFDNDKHYDPDNALYGTTEQRKEYMWMIQTSIDDNTNIKPKAVCTIPESIVKIPMKTDVNNCYV
jgi:hypothetical protein